MAYVDPRTRRVNAIHTLIGIVMELGDRIVDGYGQLDPEHTDALIEELRGHVRDCDVRLFVWDDVPLGYDPGDGLPF